MKQIELTSKLVLAIIGLASVGAILIPTYAVPTIRSADIFDGEVKTADLANGAVTNPKIANDAVTSGKIKDGEVTSADIKDKTIQSGDIADGVIPDGGGAVTLEVNQRFGPTLHVSPGSSSTSVATCNDDEVPTGGGWLSSSNIVVTTNIAGQNNWRVDGDNVGTTDGIFSAYAECTKLVP